MTDKQLTGAMNGLTGAAQLAQLAMGVNQVRPLSAGAADRQTLGNMAKGLSAGAAAGAAFGPIGAIIGGAAGLAAGSIGRGGKVTQTAGFLNPNQ
jgi:hypothetical protein